MEMLIAVFLSDREYTEKLRGREYFTRRMN